MPRQLQFISRIGTEVWHLLTIQNLLVWMTWPIPGLQFALNTGGIKEEGAQDEIKHALQPPFTHCNPKIAGGVV